MSAPLVELAGLHVHLRSRSVLTGVSMLVRERESWAVLGASWFTDSVWPSGALLHTVQALCEAGTQVVLVTHHEEDLVPAPGHVLELSGARAVYQGPRAGWRPRGAP